MDYYLGVAEKEGVSEEELSAVHAIVMAVSAGRVQEQFREVRARRKRDC